MRIGILQTGHVPDMLLGEDSYPAMFERLLAGQGFDFATFVVVDGVFPASVTECDGWLITGSRHGAYEDHPWIAPLEAFIRAAYAADVPLVGICFGHQIIAQALGGRVVKFPGGWSVGRQAYAMEGMTIHQNAWHQDQVVERPETAEVVAQSAFCENAGLVYGQRAFSVQWHPEFEADFIDTLLTHRAHTVPAALRDAARDGLGLPTDNAHLAQRIGRFFKERRIS